MSPSRRLFARLFINRVARSPSENAVLAVLMYVREITGALHSSCSHEPHGFHRCWLRPNLGCGAGVRSVPSPRKSPATAFFAAPGIVPANDGIVGESAGLSVRSKLPCQLDHRASSRRRDVALGGAGRTRLRGDPGREGYEATTMAAPGATSLGFPRSC